LEAVRKILAERPAQIAAARFDLGEARAFHDRREAAPHCLDFGEFGHRSVRRLFAAIWLISDT
jgi:hypothetical protein